MRCAQLVVIIAIAIALPPAVGRAQLLDCATPAAAATAQQPSSDSSSVRLPATIYIGAADVDWTGRERESASPALGFELGGRLFDRTQLNVSFVRGPADILSALTVASLYRSTIRASLKSPAWGVTAGELRTTNSLLAGPSLRADGLTLEMRRRIVADLTVARPFDAGITSGGHIAQGRIGIRIPAGTIALVGSDVARRLNTSTVAVPATTDTATEITDRDLDVVRRLLSRESRLRGWGAESDLRFRGAHTVLVRAGVLELANQSGQATRGAAAEMRYLFTRGMLSLNASGRHAPASVPGMYVPGDALTAGGRVPIGRGVIATAQVYSNVNWFFGQALPLRATGTSAGLQRDTKTHRFNIRYNDRHVRSALADYDLVSRTLSGSMSVPFGPIRLNARAEAGPAQRGLRTATVQRYGLSLDADVGAHSVWISGSYDDYGFQPPRARADAGVSANFGRRLALELGGGYGTGQLLGNDLSAWGKAEVPIGRGLMLVTQVDYLEWDYTASPYITLLLADGPVSPWRLTIGVSRVLSIPIPFVRRRQHPTKPAAGDDPAAGKEVREPQGYQPR